MNLGAVSISALDNMAVHEDFSSREMTDEARIGQRRPIPRNISSADVLYRNMIMRRSRALRAKDIWSLRIRPIELDGGFVRRPACGIQS
jgi:hypothetical protein